MIADIEEYITYLIVSAITISCVRNMYGLYSTDLVLRRPETSATDNQQLQSFDTISSYRYKNTG